MPVNRLMDKELVCIYNIYINTHTHTHAMEYKSANKKNELLPFATIGMDLKGIMLNEIGQIKTNTE